MTRQYNPHSFLHFTSLHFLSHIIERHPPLGFVHKGSFNVNVKVRSNLGTGLGISTITMTDSLFVRAFPIQVFILIALAILSAVVEGTTAASIPRLTAIIITFAVITFLSWTVQAEEDKKVCRMLVGDALIKQKEVLDIT